MQLRTLLSVALAATLAQCASLVEVMSFGDNPTDIQMYIYVPDQVATNPAVVVALHPCGVTGQQWFSATELPSYADSNGFILVYPATTHLSNCWDGLNNAASLTHGQGGDAKGIISEVNYTLSTYQGDASKVYVMGGSSGAMMTNVMAGSYPDVFEAGAAYSGVADACFAGTESATPASANQTCAQGLSHTPEEWGNFVRNSYPGYTGRRPRMMIVHGLADTLVYPAAAAEALKQWSNVLDVPWSKNVTGNPSAEYTQEVYGDGTQLQGFFGEGVGHIAPPNVPVMLKFFGLIA
ncbi:Uu.00g129260.m01.CDS01 [Anthostomella pinea]|uniref:Carboxylic ester hydrolase n=1 Tax=Anthostomella pinea TaxID=933095 RepID=A0AAI8VIJ2_9PEZI|nr:Uu.00g129260.m01.CDS01 [Anthostomella pinea]